MAKVVKWLIYTVGPINETSAYTLINGVWDTKAAADAFVDLFIEETPGVFYDVISMDVWEDD